MIIIICSGAPPDIPPNSTLVFDVECKYVNQEFYGTWTSIFTKSTFFSSLRSVFFSEKMSRNFWNFLKSSLKGFQELQIFIILLIWKDLVEERLFKPPSRVNSVFADLDSLAVGNFMRKSVLFAYHHFPMLFPYQLEKLKEP